MTGSDALLEVAGLVIEYGTDQGPVSAVSDVSLTLARGEVVAIVGESGSGKTTTALSIMGLLASNAKIAGGSVRFDGVELTTLSERAMRDIRGRRIGLVPQDPTVSLNPTKKIGEQIAEVLRLHQNATRSEASARAVQILDDAGLTQPALRAAQYPHELSGGMRQRVLIGMALACEPALIVADEPTSALDVTVQKRVLDLLDTRIHERSTSLILVTHDLGVAADRADRIVVMQAGRVVEDGPAVEVVRNPQHEYTRKLVAAAPSLSSGRLAPSVSFTERTERAAEPAQTVLRATDLRLSFRAQNGERSVAVDGVSLEVAAGRSLALVGESGAGKSTVARIVAKLARPDEGRIEFLGQDITDLAPGALRAMRPTLQYVYQNPYASLDPRFDVGRILGEALRVKGYSQKITRDRRILALLDQVALPPRTAWRKPRELSGGQQQRVAIARALALEPRLIVLDEPVSALDVSVQSEILQLLVDLQHQTRVAYVFITHDLAVVRQIADDVMVMNHGKVVESGPTSSVLEHPSDPYTAALLDAIPGKGATRPPLGDRVSMSN